MQTPGVNMAEGKYTEASKEMNNRNVKKKENVKKKQQERNTVQVKKI